MTSEKQDHYRRVLMEMARQTRETALDLEASARAGTGGEAAGGISNAPVHLADVSSEVFNQELGATLLENEEYIRGEVLDALARLDAGTFGVCEHTGRPIPEARLDALPYARYTVEAAAELEEGADLNMDRGRPARHLLGALPGDSHAAGTPGGGTAVGGLAGTNAGDGSPIGEPLEDALGTGTRDDADIADAEPGEGDRTAGRR